MPTPAKGYFLKDGSRVPGTTTIIGRFKESGGLVHWAWDLGIQGKDYRQVKDEAASTGSLVHAMVEADVQGHDPPPSANPEALSAFTAYLTWKQNYQFQIVDYEIPLVSEKYRYGGTPDAIGIVGNSLALLDWKTSNHIYSDYLVQLAAYIQLWEENFPHRPLIGGAHLLRFAKEHGDFAHHHFPNLKTAWRQFELFREAYENDKELKKRAA